MYKVIGIDEAGRGPVIGSMFVAFSILELKSKDEYDEKIKCLEEIGVKDSKLLSSKKRSEIFENLSKHIRKKFVQITPISIDNCIKSGGKINELEIDAIISVLKDEKAQKVFIDSLSSKPDNFAKKILSKIDFDLELVCENKADLNYHIVAAASIVAKELREREVLDIKKNIKIDCGSGYPSDPITVAFLKEHWNNKEFSFIFRKSWLTYKKYLDDNNQKSLLDY